MKVYFNASTKEKEEDLTVYQRIKNYLKRRNQEVFSNPSSEKEQINNILQCDVAVIEGSYPSTIQVGFETAMILEKGKPVIFLYKTGMSPFFINAIHSFKLIKSEYSENNLEDTLDWCFEELEHISNRRFTFFISPDIEDFLQKIAKRNKLSKSEFIRYLIKKEMRTQS